MVFGASLRRRSSAPRPTRTEPDGWKATTDGTSLCPCASVIVWATPSFTTATTVLVVPRSIPTARAISRSTLHEVRVAFAIRMDRFSLGSGRGIVYGQPKSRWFRDLHRGTSRAPHGRHRRTRRSTKTPRTSPRFGGETSEPCSWRLGAAPAAPACPARGLRGLVGGVQSARGQWGARLAVTAAIVAIVGAATTWSPRAAFAQTASTASTAGAGNASDEADSLQAALDRDYAQAMANDCGLACRALESMRRSAGRLCQLDPGERCTRAKSKVDQATQRVRTSCPTCPQPLHQNET